MVSRPSSFDLASSTLAQIAGYAASTGQILNIGDVRAWLNEKHSEGDAESARTILCMPIINGQHTLIGKKRDGKGKDVIKCNVWGTLGLNGLITMARMVIVLCMIRGFD